jgi:hypothetical protein|tara:strand:- start:1156 stop:1494 length:339 start_codon:yes stop_codon:yes gene_type:complete
MDKADQVEDFERTDTFEVVYKMTNMMGGLKKGRLAKTARIYGTSRSRLDSILKRKSPAPTLDTLSIWIARLYRKTGIKVVLTITPDMRIYYSIRSERNEKVDGVVLKKQTAL